MSGIPLAALMAEKCSHNQSFVYAAFKLYQSYRIHSTLIVDLDPSQASDRLKASSHPHDHVVFAYTIVLAYAAIEELGLNVPASEKRRSRPRGEWNPDVRQDLEKRLRRAGINVQEPIVWNLRGPASPLENGRPTPPAGVPGWADGTNVRDQYVSIVDAIADVSWLRSKVAAHKMSYLAKLLTPHDVSNAQSVAQRLILEASGILGIARRD